MVPGGQDVRRFREEPILALEPKNAAAEKAIALSRTKPVFSRYRNHLLVLFGGAVFPEIYLAKNIISELYLFMKFILLGGRVIPVLLQYLSQHSEPLYVRLEPPRRILHRRPLIYLERPVRGLREQQFTRHLV